MIKRIFRLFFAVFIVIACVRPANSTLINIKNYKNLSRFLIEFENSAHYSYERTTKYVTITFNQRINANPYFIFLKLDKYIENIFLSENKKSLKLYPKKDIDIKVLKIGDKKVLVTLKTQEKKESYDFKEVNFDLSEMKRITDDKAHILKDLKIPKKVPTKMVQTEKLDNVNFDFNVSDDIKTGIEMAFDWKDKANLAVFNYIGYTWLVFDRYTEVELHKFEHFLDKGVNEIRQIYHPEATIIRFKFKEKFYPKIFKYGNFWKIAFVKEKADLNKIKTSHLKKSIWNSNLFIEMKDLNRVIKLFNPENNEKLIVIPSAYPHHGIKTAYNFKNFKIDQTYQGVLCSNISEKSDIYPVFDKNTEGIVIFSLD